MCDEELIFNVKIFNNTSSAGNINKSAFCMRQQDQEAFFSHVALSSSLHLLSYYILYMFILAVWPMDKICRCVSTNLLVLIYIMVV